MKFDLLVPVLQLVNQTSALNQPRISLINAEMESPSSQTTEFFDAPERKS